jgi:LmbE family N-acetylglucosaminyl deacetylase
MTAMLPLEVPPPVGRPYTVLCLGAHSDDIEIGCGGTLLHFLAGCPNTAVHWVVFSADAERAGEAVESGKAFLAGARSRTIHVNLFRDGFFPFQGAEIKEYFETLKTKLFPDLIFTHHRGDLHQDHRLIADLTWQTFRSQLILEYEIPKYDGDLGAPNVFVPLDESVCRRKIQTLLARFPSQRRKHWFDEDTFLALLRLRGMECRAPDRYAEAFYGRKLVLGVGRGAEGELVDGHRAAAAAPLAEAAPRWPRADHR